MARKDSSSPAASLGKKDEFARKGELISIDLDGVTDRTWKFGGPPYKALGKIADTDHIICGLAGGDLPTDLQVGMVRSLQGKVYGDSPLPAESLEDLLSGAIALHSPSYASDGQEILFDCGPVSGIGMFALKALPKMLECYRRYVRGEFRYIFWYRLPAAD